jgi:hypothetical protein
MRYLNRLFLLAGLFHPQLLEILDLNVYVLVGQLVVIRLLILVLFFVVVMQQLLLLV